MLLKGIYPPLTTPFRNDEISFENLETNLQKYNKFELSGYVVGGSNGETVFLTEKERINLFAAVREHVSSEKQVIAGTGLESIKATIELTNEAAKIGADFALIITPHFFKNGMTNKAFINYYTAVADESNIPIIIYNVTKFTGVNILTDTVAQLAEHPNITGIKNSTTNVEDLAETIKAVPKDFTVLAGTGSVLLPALAEGAKGGVLALANITPGECIKIYNYFKVKKLKEAKEIQEELIPVNKAITATFGVAGLKAAMDMLGYYGGPPRKPLESLDEVSISELKNILIKAGLL